jgi:hypothetical protein
MQEAQELFRIEFDVQPPPVLNSDPHPYSHKWGRERVGVWHVDLDRAERGQAPNPKYWTQAFTLWLRSRSFGHHREEAAACIRGILEANPFTTLQVVLEPHPPCDSSTADMMLSPETLAFLFAACQTRPTYLDRYYALHPGRPNGAKRLVVVLPVRWRSQLNESWLDEVGNLATIVWRCRKDEENLPSAMEAYEVAWTR